MSDPLSKYSFRDQHGHPLEMCEEYQALKAEVEALRADAERYRWLRDNCQREAGSGDQFNLSMYGNLDFTFVKYGWTNGEKHQIADIDAAIDAARSKT